MTTKNNADAARQRDNPSPCSANRTNIPVAHRVAGGQSCGFYQNEKSSVTEPQARWRPMRRAASFAGTGRDGPTAAAETLEFGRFRVQLRKRQLLADGVPVELGTRAFDLFLVLLEADGSLVGKDELLSRVWPDVVVIEENLKVQISKLRKALGEDRDLIRTESGRGYRFTATFRSTTGCGLSERRRRSRHARVRRCVFR